MEAYQRLGIALGIGLLIGLERSRQGRNLKEGVRIAGLRTFGLIGFAAAITLGATALRHWMGESGVYLSAGVAGIADVDAITLSLARLARTGLEPKTAAAGIALAV